jgi:signal peptide peptidase SppA
MPANPVHHGPTVDTPWDGPAEEAALATPVTKARGNGMFAWHDASGADPDGDGYPDAKADSKFPHHVVDADGNPGAANLGGCRAVLQRLDQATIPPGDDAGVKAHAQAHLDDAQGASAEEFSVDLALITPHSYHHVTKALYERPWAVQRQMLTFMASVLRFRAAGGAVSPDEMAERLAAARAQNGPREGAIQSGAVAIIPMYGLISQRMSLMSDMSGGTSLDEIRGTLQSALADPSIKAIVFDIDSPGGSVDGVPEFAAELRQARAGSKPIVAQVNTLAASAAYWLAAQMNEIVVTPSGEVGSIGVFAMHEDYSKADEMAGIKTTLVSAGPFKTERNQFEPLSDDARANIQEGVDSFYQMFLSDVAKGRGISVQAVADGYGEGRTFLAKKALAAGMVDRIDPLEATVNRLQPSGSVSRRAAVEIATAMAAQADPIDPAALAAAHQARIERNARLAAHTKRNRRFQ